MPTIVTPFPRYRLSTPLPVSLAGVVDVFRPVISAVVFNPAHPPVRLPLEVLLDSGADCCYFPEWIAHRLHISLTGVLVTAVGGAGGRVVARFQSIVLQIGSGGRHHRWETTAGFVPNTVPLFRQGSWSGVLGQIGGFDQFRITFDWCAHPPTVALTNCRASLPTD